MKEIAVIGDTCIVLGISVALLSLYASLRALGGMPRSKRRFRLNVIRVYPLEILLVLTLIALAILDRSSDRLWLYGMVIATMIACLLRGVRFMEHGIVVGPRFLSWSQIVGHYWIESKRPNREYSTLVIRSSGHLEIQLRVPNELKATMDDLVASTARPEPQPFSRVLAYWFEHFLSMGLVAAVVALTWRFGFPS